MWLRILTYLDGHATDILFNVAALILFYLLARLVLRVGQLGALAIGVSPLLVAMAYQNSAGHSLFGLMH